MGSSVAILQSVKDSVLAANVKSVYGEPNTAQGKTVIPVAKIMYGYGGGGAPAVLGTQKRAAKTEGVAAEAALSLWE